MVFTDPPYNVGLKSRKGGRKGKLFDYTSVPYEDNKSLEDWEDFVRALFDIIQSYLLTGRCYYLWGGHKRLVDYYNLCPKELIIHQNIIWEKQWPVLSRMDYLCSFQNCIYGWRQGAPHYVNRQPEGQNYTDIWSVKKINPNKMVHSAQMPVELIEIALKVSANNEEKVLDLFGGSGSTLIACEKLGRRCFMMEIDEHYCDVIINRWENYTGKEALLIQGNGGK